ncbi:MAG: hypothetical protein ACRD29_10840 [Acidimicrobiales bacterium]
MAVITTIRGIEDQVLDTIKSVQDPTVGAVRQIAEFVDERLPELPSLPFTDQLPTPAEVVDNGFTFVRQLVEVNEAFAKALIDAAAPLLAQPAPAPRKAAAKTTKAA